MLVKGAIGYHRVNDIKKISQANNLLKERHILICCQNYTVAILMKLSSLTALEIVKMTTSSAASDDNFVKMTTFSFQWVASDWLVSFVAEASVGMTSDPTGKGQHATDIFIVEKCHRENIALQWRHNKRDGVSNHQPYDCLLNCLFRHKSQKTSKLLVTGICEGNSPVTGEFPAQRVTRTMFPFDVIMTC